MNLQDNQALTRDLPEALRLAIRIGRTTAQGAHHTLQNQQQHSRAIHPHQKALAMIQVLSIRLAPLIQAYNNAAQAEHIQSHITQQIQPGIAGRKGPKLSLLDIWNGRTVYSIATRPGRPTDHRATTSYEIELPKEQLDDARRYHPAPTYPSTPQSQAYTRNCLETMQNYLTTVGYITPTVVPFPAPHPLQNNNQQTQTPSQCPADSSENPATLLIPASRKGSNPEKNPKTTPTREPVGTTPAHPDSR